jgi:hypothetical protein
MCVAISYEHNCQDQEENDTIDGSSLVRQFIQHSVKIIIPFLFCFPLSVSSVLSIPFSRRYLAETR